MHEQEVFVMGKQPVVGVIMGSESDWETMQHAVVMLRLLGISCEQRVLSAHRTRKDVTEYASTARARGIKIIITGAGCSAHLQAFVATDADHVPVIAVPVATGHMQGQSAVLSIADMPAGVPVNAQPIGKAGAINAAIAAAQMLAITDEAVLKALREYSRELARAVHEADERIRVM